MSYKVTAPLVVIANDDLTSGDWYGYDKAVVPEGWNDDRCKQLVKEGFLEKVSATTTDAAGNDSSSDKVEDVLASVGDDKEKAAAALEQEKAGKNRKTLVEPLEKLLAS